jgi:hypothetical protein
MTKLTRFVASLAIIGLALAPFVRSARAQAVRSQLDVPTEEGRAHVFPTVEGASSLLAPFILPTGPLVYHGGPIMPNVTTYAIFWIPPHLQNSSPTSMSATYRSLLTRFLTDYPGHGIDNNNTQYSQTGPTKYIHNSGAFGGAFVDTSLYPASGCSDPATPGNCLTDGQIRHEVKKVMALEGWTGGLNHMFLVFTSSGEGSCLDNLGHCSYTFFCAYHSSIVAGLPAPIIYGNEPFADTSVCQLPGAPSPNNDAAADDAATIASHELTEAITDPLGTAWWEPTQGFEIGDMCAYNYGSLTWHSGDANEMWNGHFYLLQQEFDNHIGANGTCEQVGP